MMTQNLQDAAKAVRTGKFIAIQAYLKKQEKSQINNLTLHLKELEKEEKIKPSVSRRKEIIKMRAEINEIETMKTIERSIKLKAGSLRRETKLINHQPDSSRKRGRGLKSRKLEMKNEKLQQTLQKYTAS